MPLEGKVIADVAWHAVKRTVSVILVLVFLIGVPWVAYEKGRAKGYSQCAKDRPTYGSVGTVNQADPKDVPFTIFRFTKIGFVWFRK